MAQLAVYSFGIVTVRKDPKFTTLAFWFVNAYIALNKQGSHNAIKNEMHGAVSYSLGGIPYRKGDSYRYGIYVGTFLGALIQTQMVGILDAFWEGWQLHQRALALARLQDVENVIQQAEMVPLVRQPLHQD